MRLTIAALALVLGSSTLSAQREGHTAPNGSAVLTYHVVDGKVRINDATVVSADVQASNGVIHVIDTVILPKN